MAQEGRGKKSSIPASFFEIDDFDTHWEGEGAPELAKMREPSKAPAEPSSEVQASSAPTGFPPAGDADAELHAPLELDFALELDDALPLNDPCASQGPANSASRSAKTVPHHGRAATPNTTPTGRPPASYLADAARVSEPAEFDFELNQQHEQLADEQAADEQAADEDDGSRTTSPDDPALAEARDRYATGDYSGALAAAESVLARDVTNELARRYADNCRQVLTEMYLARIGGLGQTLHVAVEGDRLRWLSLDHRAGFLISLVDGSLTLEELLDISGMPRFEALRILDELLDQNVVSLRHGR